MKNMKKISTFTAAILFLYILCAAAAETEVLEIKEKMFVQQCNDIYFNADDYLGKTVRLEGMYLEIATSSGETNRYVYRKTPGCCGDDGAMAGFRVLLDESPSLEQNEWVEATGTVEPSSGYENVVLRLSNLKVLDTRGAEFVSN